MNLTMIRHLVSKDFSQSKYYIAMYSVFGILSVSISLIGADTWFYVSMVFAITCLIGVGLHPMFVHILVERKEQNFPFVMSLPVTHMEFTIGKILFVYLFAGIPWLCVVLTTTVIALNSPLIPVGFLGPAVIIAFEMFAAYSGTLAIALVITSEPAMVATIVIGNIGVNFFIMWLFRMEEVVSVANSTTFAWNSTLSAILGAELAFLVFVLALTCLLQSRKKDLI